MAKQDKQVPGKETIAQPMREKKPINHLTYVSWAFMFLGILALVQTIQSFVNDPAPIPDFLMVFIVVGWGLLRRKPFWRTFALSCAYVFFIFNAGNLFMIISGSKTLDGMSTFSLVMFWMRSIMMIGAGGYAIWALQTKSVREQFESKV